jgi:hypothetical protein
MLLIRPLLIALLLPAPTLFSQRYIDVTPEKTYVGMPGEREIFELSPDLSLTKLPSLIQENLNLHGRPRPRVRLGKIWLSNGKRIYNRSLDATSEEGWETAVLPEGLTDFCDFEIISKDEIVLCGAEWFEEVWGVPLKYDLHFVFNHRNGAITRVIEELDRKHSFVDRPSDDAFFDRSKAIRATMYSLGPKILIVGRFSGLVTIIDGDGGGARKIRVVPEDEIPAVPERAVNDGWAIPWVGPLEGDAALICCKKVTVREDGQEPGREFVFRTLDLKTGKVTLEGSSYRGIKADGVDTLFEQDGDMHSVRDLMAKGGFGELRYLRELMTKAGASDAADGGTGGDPVPAAGDAAPPSDE